MKLILASIRINILDNAQHCKIQKLKETIKYKGKLQFPGEKSLPLAFRPKISVFLRNRGC